MEKIIEVRGLKKSFREVQAVKGIDFYVESGSLFAFLGPNGAGKSTTIEIICTLLRSDEGEVEVAGYKVGKDDEKIRESIGVVFQDGVLDNLLTVKENLSIRGSFYGMDGKKLKAAVDFAANCAGCSDFLNKPYGKLSGGQRRRADIARALVNTPKILFLDEPTTGLDPHTRATVWETVKKLQRETGMTVFLTTHYMEEAADADYVAVIDKGLITAKGTPSELKERYSRDYLSVKPKDKANVKKILDGMGAKYSELADLIKVELPDTISSIPIIEAIKREMEIFEVRCGSLDEAFVNITGEIS